ncbi:Na+/H+ antiporter subunit E [Massilia dura]|uniref:Na+/H+ antiporter subunit E n=1 Tax=Pseudoduganella dura TaxID=321982 RepID=A0A6I3X7H8_9BURK|nr:Na+/H+ antiporter subunit E [Pseudoduganella dura]MUI11706.1 Na+/H+ antiporter subunit E [Pseudoduganella dura]GGX78462.1 Na+/H+ antiporter subunit E [Pseudoduganella dura]
MMRWLPFPVVSLALCAVWLLLNQALDPANLLFGAVLGIAVPLLTRRLQPLGYPRLRRPFVFARLLAMASAEIVRSCFAVCRIILFRDYGTVHSQFIRVPLTMRDPYGLAMLSCLINMTPGTVWIEILPERHELALHVFDLQDEAWWIDTIRTRYEQPLMAIFETEEQDGNPA